MSAHGRSWSTNDFAIALRSAGQFSVLVVRGSVDVTRCRRLSFAVNEALGAKPERLVLDLHGVELIDPAALSVLVSARRRAQRLGIALKLVCDVPSALQVLSLTGLDRAFDVYPTSESALEAGEVGNGTRFRRRPSSRGLDGGQK